MVFRTAPYGVLGRHAWRGRVAFEVDDIDVATRSGWSVVATGQGELVEDPDELAAAPRLPRPAAVGARARGCSTCGWRGPA